jgi:UrcA family protein
VKDLSMNRIALAAALAASLVAVPAAAETVTVGFADLNTANPIGAEILAKRVENGADVACQRPDMRDLKATVDFNSCKQEALASAADQLTRAGARVDVIQIALN